MSEALMEIMESWLLKRERRKTRRAERRAERGDPVNCTL